METKEKLVITDDLTGIYNRRYLMHRLKEEVKRVKRYNYYFSILLFDIDYFKNVNDTFGHLAGDEVLKKITKIVEKQIREVDIFARYGGDEFVLVLPWTDLQGATTLANRLLQVVSDFEIKIIDVEQNIRVTLSIGIATYPEDVAPDDITGILQKADKAMYNAKKTGRNRIKRCFDLLHEMELEEKEVSFETPMVGID